jgi:thiamine biosynthesis lipoprotein
MDTECRIDFMTSKSAAARRWQCEIPQWISEFESRYSRFRPDSLISRINRAAGREWVAIDSETESLFLLCEWFFRATNGIFDPTLLPLIELWDYRGADPRVPPDEAIQAARARIGWGKVQRAPGRIFLPEAGMGLDLGGIAKEYAVDRVLEMVVASGIDDVLVDFGHDIRVHGEPPEGGPWRIGLEDPRDPGKCWTGLAVRDRAVCTSGDYLRYFSIGARRYGHILDPRTGKPVNNGCQAVSVIAPTCTEAGILSTTAFILGGAEGLDFLNAQYQAAGCLWMGNHCLQTRRLAEYAC